MSAESMNESDGVHANRAGEEGCTRRRKLKFDDLADAASEVKRLSQAAYERAGTWSLQQVLQHLNKTMDMSIDGYPFLLPALARPVVKLIALPLMRRGVQFPSGAKAPSGLLPSDDADLETEVARFCKLVRIIADPSTKLHPQHPLVGKINHEQWNVMQRWHAAHHLSFIVPR